MRAISVSQDREAKFAIAIAKQESRITLNTAAMCKVTIAVPNRTPPGQAKARRFIAPDVFDFSFELVVLSREHLLKRRLADDLFIFELATVEIDDEPVSLVEHRAIDQTRRPDRGLNSHGSHLGASLFIESVRNRKSFVHVWSRLECRTVHL